MGLLLPVQMSELYEILTKEERKMDMQNIANNIMGLLSFVWVNFHKSGKKEVNILSLRYTRSLIP